MTFKQRPELRAAVSLLDIWGKSVPGRGDSRGKGLEARLCLACLGDSKGDSVSRAEGARGEHREVISERLRGPIHVAL